jgi:hypothetical protein
MDEGRQTGTTADAGAIAPVVIGRATAAWNNVSELKFPGVPVCATVAGNDIHLSMMEDPADIHEMHPADSDFRAHVFASDPGTENRLPGPGHALPADGGGGAGMNDTNTEQWAMTALPTFVAPRAWPDGMP